MHGDNDTNIRCPRCGALHWYCTTNEADEDIGKCDNGFHNWPIDFDELDKQILETTCPLGHCEARNCEIDKCLDEETGITEITGYCSSCERYWTQFKKGDKWIL
jgi:hypothetical protein